MDRDDIKARSRRHLQNKTKFKDKSKIQTVQRDKRNNYNESAVDEEDIEFEKTALKSNWSRYDESASDTISSSTNYALLAETPVSHGGRFQFKSDKSIDLQVDENQLFKLDMNLISKSLLTFPITSRCGIPIHYFTDEEVEMMEKKAGKQRKDYLQYISKTEDVPVRSTEHMDKNISGKKTLETINTEDKIITRNESSEQQNLEEWLDDFLDS